jgi:hypothetical protein
MNKENPKYKELADKLESVILDYETKHPHGHPKHFEYMTIINRCTLEYYHDFNSPHPTPKLLMIADLKSADLTDEVQKVKDGYYDE